MQTLLTTTTLIHTELCKRVRTSQKNHIKSSASQNLQYVWLIVCRRHRTRSEESQTRAEGIKTHMKRLNHTSRLFYKESRHIWSVWITRVVCFMASLHMIQCDSFKREARKTANRLSQNTSRVWSISRSLKLNTVLYNINVNINYEQNLTGS